MSSFIFNEFKKRFLKGEVENNGTKWFFRPVKKDFIENLTGENIKPEQFKDINSIREYLNSNASNGFVKVMCDLYKIEYEYSKLVEAKYSNKPAYITIENFAEFTSVYPRECNLKTLVDTYGGFYYIKTKEELKWCANRVNGDNDDGERCDNFNNHIVIALGDDIGENNSKTKIDFVIGRYPDRPFEGLLYGNGYVFQNINFVVTQDVGGIVGYLGHYGKISEVNIFGNMEVECTKKISLSHIKNQGTDIYFGAICAANRGTIENCRYSSLGKLQQNIIPKVTFKGFVPQVYLVQNKSENLSEPVTDSKDNEFYPNYMCINSPGNIIPYVGYFNEGIIAATSAKESTTDFWLDGVDDKNSDWTGTMLLGDMNDDDDGTGAKAGGYGNEFIFDYNNVKETAKSLGFSGVRSPKFGYNCLDKYSEPLRHNHSICHTRRCNWVNQPVKLHQFARAAYYISPFCGWSKGNLVNCESKAKAVFEGTFVGFCGGLVGKSAGGKINGCNAYISPNDDDTCSRTLFMASAASNIAEHAPTIDFRVDLWNWTDVLHQDLDDIVHRQYSDEQSAQSAQVISGSNIASAADVFTWDEQYANVNKYHDNVGICQCPWHMTAQGIMLNFEGLSATSSTKKTALYTFPESKSVYHETLKEGQVGGNSALNIYNAAMSTGLFTSGEGYEFTEKTEKGGVTEIHTLERIHKNYYDQFTYDNGKHHVYSDNVPSAKAVWFPLVKKSDSAVYTDFKYDPDTNCYVIKNAQFYLGCGYEVIPNNYYLTSGNEDSKIYPNYIVDAVYPNFFDSSNNHILKVQKDSKYNHPNSASKSWNTSSYNSTYNEVYNVEIDRLKANNGNFTLGIQFDPNSTGDDTFYDNSVDFTSAAKTFTPTITIDEIYLTPFNNNARPEDIKKYINGETEYIEGFPLAITKMKGIHVKNRHSYIVPKSNSQAKTQIQITDYEFHIKAIGVKNEVKSRSDLNTQYPDITQKDPKNPEIEYKWKYNESYKRSRAFIGNCAIPAYDIFDVNDDSLEPFSSMKKPQYLLNVRVGAIGESFRTNLQSIYNVGGLIGSMAFSPTVTEIYNTSAFLDNHISEGLIVSANSDKTKTEYVWNQVNSKNYSFLNRFGGLAAICEFNTSNIGDNAIRPLVCSNVNLHYEEETAAHRSWDNVDTSENSAYYAKRDFYGPIQLDGNIPECRFGVGSPIVAEIKPTYNMFPGINSYINTWPGDKCDAEPKDSKYDEEHPGVKNEVWGYSYYGDFSHDLGLMYNDYNLGINTLDLNVDLPIQNMNIDNNACNADSTGYKNDWLPGMNIPGGNDLGGLPFLAQSLFRGINIKQNYYGYYDANNIFHNGPGYRRSGNVLCTVHYPAAICRDLSLNMKHNHVYYGSNGKNAKYEYYDVKYQTSKHESTYSYYGSSLKIYADESGKKVDNDLYMSFQNDWSVCQTNGPDLSNAKLQNYSNSYFKQRQDLNQYFTYTYSATTNSYDENGNLKKMPLLNYDVKFAMANNGKVGYWLRDPVDNVKGDNITYKNNIIHIGITKSPEQIRKEIMEPANKGKCITSAISGEDFAGLWVYDNKGNNVMYIDTSVGDCDGLSTWSMQLDPGYVDGKQMGCILEIK